MHLMSEVLAGLFMGIYAILLDYIFKNFKKRWIIYLIGGITFCLISSVIYALKVLEIMKYSSILVVSIVCFSILLAYSIVNLQKKDIKILFYTAFIIGFTFKIGIGTQLSYLIIYPALSNLGYTGTMYTAIGNLGILLQIFLESAVIFLIAKFMNIIR